MKMKASSRKMEFCERENRTQNPSAEISCPSLRELANTCTRYMYNAENEVLWRWQSASRSAIRLIPVRLILHITVTQKILHKALVLQKQPDWCTHQIDGRTAK